VEQGLQAELDRQVELAQLVHRDRPAQQVLMVMTGLLAQPDRLVEQDPQVEQDRVEQMVRLGVREPPTLRVALMVTFTLKQIPIRCGRRRAELGL